MCGIWAVFPYKEQFVESDLEMVDQVMTLTSLRGKDSTGVAVVSDPSTKPRIMKKLGGPDFLINEDAYNKLMEFTVKKGKAMFGHGRFSTVGSVTVKNAHPHIVDHITMVHNGTIRSGLEDIMKEQNIENDSLALCYKIAKEGLVSALSSISGAYAIILHDAKEGAIYIVRNDERPLHQLTIAGNKILMSEEAALVYLSKKSNLYSTNTIPNYFPKNLIYRHDLTTGEFKTSEELIDAIAKKAPPVWMPKQTQAASGTSGQTTTPKGSTNTVYYPDGYKMILVMLEKMPKGQQYRAEFLSEDNEKVVAMTSSYSKDRLGQTAIASEVGVIVTHSNNDTTKFVRWRELKWEEDSKEKEGSPDQRVRFRTGQEMSRAEAIRILNSHDCGLCSSPIGENEIEDTILTQDKSVICKDCISQGRHFAFGFGQ